MPMRFKGMEIHVISLADDYRRREVLASRFPERFSSFKFVDALDFRLGAPSAVMESVKCRRLVRNPLSAAEVGCALSHLKALEIAASGRAKSVLILEDDVIGTDDAVSMVEALVSALPEDHFLLCGGQEGLKGRRFLYGQSYRGVAYRVPKVLTRFTARACCYAVSPNVAARVAERQRNCLDRADHWRALLKEEENIFYAKLFSHPLDLTQSHLEGDRFLVKQRSPLRQAWGDGFGYAAATQAVKLASPALAKMFGWTKLE